MSWRGSVTTVLVAWMSLAFLAPAHAHAAYEGSDPADGSTVSSPPSRITADFTERLVDGSRLSVYDPCGDQVDGGDSLVVNDRLTVSMSADKQGTYRVHFAVVSSIDGHPTNGDFTFTSSGGDPCQSEESGGGDTDSGNGGDSSTGSSGGRGSTGSTSSGGGSTGRSTRGPSHAPTNDSTRSEKGTHSGGTRNHGLPRSREQGPGRSNRRTLALEEESQDPSALDGLELVPFLMTMGVAVVIGATAGRVYVLLADDD